ncbi:MAG TPA: sulfatase-like hydrolase/transferase [Pirellulaceae bacterium]|jgi:uncharacterized sulfatase|nr:sulfatase-like hydrolase/transferase [Pirellulaceae bacterium]
MLPSRFLHSAAALLALAASAQLPAAEADRPPNFVIVFIDDMGWGDFSCFGNEDVETENVDRLAKEGLRFEQFYVASPICSPSRTALLTGQYPQRWRIGSYLADRKLNENRGIAQWLDPAAPTLARTLHEGGYATGHFGKWHLGGQRDVGEAPLIGEYGFDESLTNFEGLGPRVLPLLDDRDGKPAKKHALGSDKLGRGPIDWADRADVTGAFVDATIDFIDRAEQEEKPFFVNVWPDDVHSPFHPIAGRRGDGSKRARYLGVLDSLDETLGRLFDRVRESQTLRDNTLILVCSDNGPEPGAGSAGPFRGTKAQLYEGGIRSPLIVWGPGFVATEKAGAVNRTSVLSTLDVAPTLATMAGASDAKHDLDGEALTDVFLGKSDASRSKPLFFRRPPDRDGGAGDDLPDLSVRDGKWKLLCEYDGSQPQLYDLTADPGETKNVVVQHPGVAARLTAALVTWHASMPADRGETFREPRRAR